MKQNASQETNSRSNFWEMFSLLWGPNFHNRVHKSSQ